MADRKSAPDLEFDPERRAQLAARAKAQIRNRMRSTRQAYPAPVAAAKSRAICENLLELSPLVEARSVALFAPLLERREVDLTALAEELLGKGVALYYPFLDPTPSGFRTGFRKVLRLEELSDRGQKFPEPHPEAPEASRGDIEIVVVPALAVAADGHRVGYGMGYYDATLPDVAPPALCVVVAYDFQLLAELPAEPHDRPCDWVVTDRRTLRVG